MRHVRKLFAVAITSLVLAGCSKESDKASLDSKKDADKGAISPAQSAPKSALPKADKSFPYENYKRFEKAGFIYYSFPGVEIEYEKLVGAIDKTFHSETDEFKKKDRLNNLKSKIDAEISAAKEIRYYYEMIGYQIEKYDFEKKSFLSKTFPGRNSYSGRAFFSGNDGTGIRLAFNNDDQFTVMEVKNEEVARKIEALRSKTNGNFTAKLYFYVAGSGLEDVDYELHGGRRMTKKSPLITAEIVKISLLDDKGNVIHEY